MQPHTDDDDDDNNELVRLHRTFWQLGACQLLSELRGADAPPVVGANGGDSDEEEGSSRGVKRKRPGRPLDELAWMQGHRIDFERLAGRGSNLPALARVYATSLAALAPAKMRKVLAFVLQPRFLSGHGGLQEVGHMREQRMRVAVKEIRIKLAAFSALAEVAASRSEFQMLHHTLVNDRKFQVQLYGVWLSQATAPLWVGDIRYPGPRFSETTLAAVRPRIPMVQQLEHDTWYLHYMANQAFHWHFGEVAREVWAHGLGGREPDVWSWPGVQSRRVLERRGGAKKHLPNVWEGMLDLAFDRRSMQLDNQVHMLGITAVAVPATAGTPPQLGPVLRVMGVDSPAPQPEADKPRQATALSSLSRTTVRQQYARVMLQLFRLVTLVRMPCILWDPKRYPHAVGNRNEPIPRREIRMSFLTEQRGPRRAPFLLFDEPLRAFDLQTSQGPWAFDFAHRPRLDKACRWLLRGVRFLDMTNTSRTLSRWLRSVSSRASLEHSGLTLSQVTQLYSDPGRLILWPPPGRLAEAWVQSRLWVELRQGRRQELQGFWLEDWRKGIWLLPDVGQGQPERLLIRGQVHPLYGTVGPTPAWLRVVQRPLVTPKASDEGPSDRGDVVMEG